MSATAITVTKLTRNTSSAIPTTAAVDATDGAEINFDGLTDERVMIILENAAAAEKTATIKKGNGIQGVADLDITLAASAKVGIVIESMKFKNVSGTASGKVIITGTDANVKVAAIQLP